MDISQVILALSLLVSCGPVNGLTYYYMENYCSSGPQTLDMSFDDAIRLQLTYSSTYHNNEDCVLTVRTSSSDRLMLFFRSMDIENSLSCDDDWLELHDGSSTSSSYMGPSLRYCGYSYPSGVRTTSGQYLTLRFKSDSSVAGRGFDMIITSYHTGYCYSYEHECSNGRCIDSSETCNGYNPCGDYSDCNTVILSVGGIAGIVVGGIFATVFIIVVVLIVVRRRRRYVGVRTGIVNTTTTTTVAGGPQYGYNQPPSYQQPPPQYQPAAGTTYPAGTAYPAGTYGSQQPKA